MDIARVEALLARERRVILGITGPPGAGKTRLAELVASTFDDAVHVPVDGFHLADVWPMEYAKAVTVPTLVAQVRDDFLTKPSNVQEIYDTISSKDKKLFWIEGTDQRFQGYNYFGQNPQLVLDWFGTHINAV